MGESVVVDPVPIALHEGADKQEQGALGLMEVGNHPFDNMVSVAGGDDNLSGGMQDTYLLSIHILKEGLQGLDCRKWVGSFVRYPLRYVEVFCIGIVRHHLAQIIETLQCSDARGAYGDGSSLMLQEFLYGSSSYGDMFRVHVVVAYLLALYGLECSGAYVQGHLFPVDTLGI